MGLCRLANSTPAPGGSGGWASGQALLSMRGTWGAGRLNPFLPSSHQPPSSGGSPGKEALPRKSLLGELPLLPLPCVWQEDPGLRFLLRPLLDICLGRSQVGAWAARRPPPCVGQCSDEPLAPSPALVLSAVLSSFCECRAVSASRPLSAFHPHLLPVTQEFPKHSDLADSTILWFVTVA